MNEITELIKEIGFPVLVCLWFMNRTDKKLDKMVSLLDKIGVKLDLPEAEKND